ncbi:Guanine nucleotide-binding-like protein 1 [Mortierella sp. AD011]|nr:Guanine nucleotide-binding-like protein 1 [Mortierella sp. AD010]KAF9399199.1 Guanine nucleotide-binding-like protein 1 [Mortierella sp. AD011]
MPRPVAFSGALKRKQLKEKRARLHNKAEEKLRDERLEDSSQPESSSVNNNNRNNNSNSNDKSGTDPYDGRFVKGYSKPFKPDSYGAGGGGRILRSVFLRRSAAEIKASRKESMQPLQLLAESELEVSFEAMFPEVIGFPKRPKWDYSMSRQELEKNEVKMFEAWMDSVYNQYPADELSYFEHNLEVWRQLWRVLEISDIIMIIVDIRHPVIHFPPSLYQYVVKEMNRKLVVVFNKIDLVAPNTLFAWKQYFKEKFPELHIASFSCYPPDPSLINDSSTAALQRVVKRPRGRFYNAVGVRDVLEACKDVELSKNGDQVDWDSLIAQQDARKKTEFQESDEESDQDHHSDGDDDLREGHNSKNLLEKQSDRELDTTLQTVNIEDEEHMPHKDYVTIGLVAQVQEPYSVVQYLAMRINLPRLLKLDPPPNYERGPFRWSAYGVCESFALQRGFLTAKSAYPDVYRAANAILRLVNDGRILLSFKPPGFFTSTKYEQLRVAEADASAIIEDKQESQVKKHTETDQSHSDDEEDSEDQEEEDVSNGKEGSGFQVNTRVGGFFGLLQDDENESDDDEDAVNDDEDEQ